MIISNANINNIFNKDSYPFTGKVIFYTQDHSPYMICDAEVPYIMYSEGFGCFYIKENPLHLIMNKVSNETKDNGVIELKINASDIPSHFTFSFEADNLYIVNDKMYCIRSRGECRLNPTLSFSLDNDIEPITVHIMDKSTIELLDNLYN